MRTRARRLIAVSGVAIVVGLFGAAPADAHPLGNFSINHLDSLRFQADRVVDHAIIDTAEIPTAQAATIVDTDGDGSATTAELNAYGAAQCDDYSDTLTLTVGGVAAPFSVTSLTIAYQPGQAGLPTTRLECHLEAPVDLTTAQPVVFANEFAPNRVGWHEIIANGDGARIEASPVPTKSATDDLRSYPVDLLSSPLNVRSATFDIRPGAGESTVAATSKPGESTFAKAVGPFSGLVDRVNRVFNDLVGRRDLTLGVGLLAIGLALILGASHALLPGHGKTVMAAYIAGRQGSVRDAVLVGATVTATHTGGVLLLGLALTLSTSLAGESVLGWLGITSGVMIAFLGGSLLLSAIRHRGSSEHALGHTHRHGFGGHTHSHGFGGHSHDDDHGDSAVHDHDHSEHDHGDGHLHSHGEHSHTHDSHTHDSHTHDSHTHDSHTHDHQLAPAVRELVGAGPAVRSGLVQAVVVPTAAGRVSSDVASTDTSAAALLSRHLDVAPTPAAPVPQVKHFSRRGLIGMGIAGGLVPSPSALVVLLSAIALGRTIFGVVLVIGYGVGMAGTLTAAGVLLVRVRDRYQSRISAEPGRVRRAAARWTKFAPYCTAALVLIVGLGLAIRSLGSI